MLRKLVFVGMILVLMASFTVVLADQDGNSRWCNSDQYGCWVTNEEGGKDYIMFWSESARELFMGPGSNAVVADPFPAGKMPLQKAPAAPKTMSFEEKLDAYAQLIWDNGDYTVYNSFDELYSAMADFYNENPESLEKHYNGYLKYLDYQESAEPVEEENTNVNTEVNTNTNTEANTTTNNDQTSNAQTSNEQLSDEEKANIIADYDWEHSDERGYVRGSFDTKDDYKEYLLTDGRDRIDEIYQAVVDLQG